MFSHIVAFYAAQYHKAQCMSAEALHAYDRCITYRFWTTLQNISFLG